VVEPKKLILIGDGPKSGIKEVDESTSTNYLNEGELSLGGDPKSNG
jgi:hypothetical protein